MRAKSRHQFPVFAAPLERIGELPTWARAWFTAVALVQAVVADLFFVFLLLAAVAATYDWYLGRMAARKQEADAIAAGEKPAVVFDEETSRYGLHSKMAGFLILLLIRLAEAALAFQYGANTHGIPSAVASAGLFFQELESLEKKRLILGAQPLPFFSRLLRVLRSTVDRIFPVDSVGR